MVTVKKPSVKNSSVMGGVAIAIVILAAIAVYFYIQYQNTQNLLKNPTAAARQEVKALITQVGKLVLLPTGEAPTVATVSDKNKLKSQAFFAHAENGDKLLMYTKAGKAYLYRPTLNMLIEVAPLNIGESQNIPSTSAPVTPAAKVVQATILNGSKVSGAAKSVETKIATDAKLGKSVQVTETGNAKGDFPQTMVYDVTGKNTTLVDTLAKFLGGQVGNALPATESTPATAILIIIGVNSTK